VPALIEHHAAESVVVIDCRDETAATGLERGRLAPVAVRDAIVERKSATVGCAPIARGKALQLLRRYAEAGVPHTERRKNALLHEFSERAATRTGNQHSEHIHADVVAPLLARMMQQR